MLFSKLSIRGWISAALGSRRARSIRKVIAPQLIPGRAPLPSPAAGALWRWGAAGADYVCESTGVHCFLDAAAFPFLDLVPKSVPLLRSLLKETDSAATLVESRRRRTIYHIGRGRIPGAVQEEGARALS